jgi:putative polyhydroxyalkanoate system protein
MKVADCEILSPELELKVMPSINVSIPHQLSRPEAKRRVEEMVGQFQRDYGGRLGRLDERWNGDTLDFSFAAMGMTTSGHVYVEDQVVRLDVDLPWMLAMLAGRMKQEIEQKGRKLLSASGQNRGC